MANRQVTIYLSDEIIEQINAEKGQLNKRLQDLIQKGLDTEQGNANDVVLSLLTSAKQLASMRKAGELIYKGEINAE